MHDPRPFRARRIAERHAAWAEAAKIDLQNRRLKWWLDARFEGTMRALARQDADLLVQKAIDVARRREPIGGWHRGDITDNDCVREALFARRLGGLPDLGDCP